MKRFKMGIISSLVLATSALVAPAHATTYTDNYAPWSSCSTPTSYFCIEEFQTDSDGDSTTTWQTPPAGVTAEAYFFNQDAEHVIPSFSVNFKSNNGQELAPDLPVGSKIHSVFNLGSVNPRVDFANATATVLKWESEKIGNNWILTLDLQTLPYSFATKCWPWSDPWSENGQSGDFCTNPQSRHDYESYAQVAIWSNDQDPAHPEKSQQSGVWVANNATGGESPYLDAQSMTMTMNYAGPPTKIDGSPNFISAQAFFSDATLTNLYGVDPSSLTSMSSFSVTRTDGNSTSTVTATLNRVTGNSPGVVVNIPNIVTYVSTTPNIRSVADQNNMSKTLPKVKIKIKKFNPTKPGSTKIASKRVNGKYAALTFSGAKFATGIETKCTKGKTVKKSSDALMGWSIASIKLKKGTWDCKVRAVRKASGKTLYGAWSPSSKVKIK